MILKRYLIIHLLWLSFLCLAVSAQTVAPPLGSEEGKQTSSQDSPRYRQLVERAKSGDVNVDFVQLYSAYSDWQIGTLHQTNAPNRDAMVEAFKKKDYRKAVDLADGVLDYQYVNIGLHLATEKALRKLGDKTKADFHHGIAEKLLNALLSTGDGKSVETAFCVMGISDEYRIMRHFGIKVRVQAFLMSDKSHYDSLSGKDKKTGKEVGLYFDISGHFSRCIANSKARQK